MKDVIEKIHSNKQKVNNNAQTLIPNLNSLNVNDMFYKNE